MEMLILGAAIFFNIAIVKFKFDRGRIADATLDATLLVAVAVVFSGSTAALTMGTIGSVLVSIYLTFSPLRFPNVSTR